MARFPRTLVLKTLVNEEEKKLIEQYAQEDRISVSAYLRINALNKRKKDASNP
jgi:hypothetical protein